MVQKQFNDSELQVIERMAIIIYAILAYLVPIIGGVVGVIQNDVPLFLSCLAIGWCCKLEVTKHSLGGGR